MMVHVEADRAGKGGFAEVDHYNGVYYVIDLLDYTRPHTHVPGPGGLDRTFIFFMNLHIINDYWLQVRRDVDLYKFAIDYSYILFRFIPTNENNAFHICLHLTTMRL